MDLVLHLMLEAGLGHNGMGCFGNVSYRYSLIYFGTVDPKAYSIASTSAPSCCRISGMILRLRG